MQIKSKHPEKEELGATCAGLRARILNRYHIFKEGVISSKIYHNQSWQK
jgi:hypothetical protein